MDITPLQNRIFVHMDEPETVTQSGIILTEGEKPHAVFGSVVAIGPEVKDVKVGDRILFTRYTGDTVKHNDETLVTLREPDVLAVEEDLGI